MDQSSIQKKRKLLVMYFILFYLLAQFLIPFLLRILDLGIPWIIVVVANIPIVIVGFLMYRWSSYSSQIRTISFLLIVLNFLTILIDIRLIPYPFSGFFVLVLLIIAFGLLLFSLAARGELIYTRFSTFLSISMGIIILQRAFFDVIITMYDTEVFSGNSQLITEMIYIFLGLSIFLLQLAALDAVNQEKREFFDE
ncbi:MAG: hypothetical protein AB7U79_09270 [Candidatus Izemoplasmatales bacterium]